MDSLMAFLSCLLQLLLIMPVLSDASTLSRLSLSTKYRTLNTATILRQTATSTVAAANSGPNKDVQTDTRFRLRIVHRDSLLNTSHSYQKRFFTKLARDVARVRALRTTINEKLLIHTEANDFQSIVVSGVSAGSGEYFARIGVGTPPREHYMVLDTGSDVVWIQCRPCKKCYDQVDPLFDPTLSATFSPLPCDASACGQLQGSACESGKCHYSVAYGDGSRTSGVYATEKLTFSETVVENVAVGCGQENVGLFVGASGLLGLGAGPLSFASQLAGETGGVFSYCLVDRESQGGATVEFGASVSGRGSIVVPLLRNPLLPTFYYLSVAGIVVGNSLLSIPAEAFAVDEKGRGGFIIDSGTAVTRLHEKVYATLRESFVGLTVGLRRAAAVAIFDTCYDLSGTEAVRVPAVGFYFSNGATVMLPARNYMVPVDSSGTFCLAFAPSPSGPSIIGNIQQQGIRVAVDSVNSVVGFTPSGC